MASKSQYPDTYNPPNRGKCERCGVETKAWDKRWLALCPKCWGDFVK